MGLILERPFLGLRENHFRVIYVDSPWRYVAGTKSRPQHYPRMSIDELCALPVRRLAAPDCVLMFWVIDSHEKLAHRVIDAWGFKFKTVGLYWAKQNADGSFFMSTGHWTRANPEHAWECYLGETEQEVERCFLNTIGAPKRQAKNVPRLIVSKRREHSRKPDEAYDRIERLVDGPYLELFSRSGRKNWTSWGNQLNRFAHTEQTPATRRLLMLER